jgi:hypothetical protein
MRADGNMYCTTKLEDASKPSFSFPSPSKRKKMTALVDQVPGAGAVLFTDAGVAKRRQGKNRKKKRKIS